jgi:hypothetical protein
MKAAIHVNHAEHQRTHAGWMAEGLKRHGIATEFAPANVPVACDFAVIWGWKQQGVIRAGRPILVMERGHLQDRMVWTSCGWNGLGRRATYAAVDDGGVRFREYWGALMQPWREARAGTALILGQCPGDAALHGTDLVAWATRCASVLAKSGWDVVFRPHPLQVRRGLAQCPPDARLSRNADIGDDLKDAAVAVTFNSTAGVEAILAGVPVVAMDEGSMAWDVAGHGFAEIGRKPDRTEWAHRLAWCQFSEGEIATGFAWDCVKDAMPLAAAA